MMQILRLPGSPKGSLTLFLNYLTLFQKGIDTISVSAKHQHSQDLQLTIDSIGCTSLLTFLPMENMGLIIVWQTIRFFKCTSMFELLRVEGSRILRFH